MMRLRTTAAHLTPASVASPQRQPQRDDDNPLHLAPLSPLLPWGRLLTHTEPLPELLSDDDCAATVRKALLEHGVLCFRPSPGSKLLAAAEFSEVLGRLNPGAQSDGDALARMKTYESTPADPATDATDPEARDCPKAHVEGWPNIRLLGSERDVSTGRAKQLLCKTGYEWHTDNVGPSHTALYCQQSLTAGGETLFTSAARMYELLTPVQQRELESLMAVHSNQFTAGGPSAFDCHHGLRMNALGTEVVRPSLTQRPSWTLASASGPLLERHSVTDVPYLVVVAKNLERIEGMSVKASREKLTELMLPGLGGMPDASKTGRLDWDGSDGLTIGKTHFNPAFVYEHRWQAGDLVIWDNETILHSTTPVDAYQGGPRVIWQIVQDTSLENNAADTASDVMIAGGSEHPPRAGASHLRMTPRNRKST